MIRLIEPVLFFGQRGSESPYKTFAVCAILAAGFVVYFIIRRITKSKRSSQEETLSGVDESFYDDIVVYQRIDLDWCVGSGWFSPFDYTVSIAPFTTTVRSRPAKYSFSDTIPVREFEQRFEGYKEQVSYANPSNLCCFNLLSSERSLVLFNQMESFWRQIQGLNFPVSFEIVSTGEYVAFQFLCHPKDKEVVYHQILSMFPSANPSGEDPDYLKDYLSGLTEFSGVSLGLKTHYASPIFVPSSFAGGDPLNNLLTILGDGGAIQALVCSLKDNWVKQLDYLADLTEQRGDVFSDNFYGLPYSAKAKCPLFAVCLRAVGKQSFLEKIDDAFAAFQEPNGNVITSHPLIPDDIRSSWGLESREDSRRSAKAFGVPFERPDVPRASSVLAEQELQAILKRDTYRHGFVINSRELTSLLHFPSKSLQHPKLLGQKRTQLRVSDEFLPENGQMREFVIGNNEYYGGQKQRVVIPEESRVRPIYIVGKPGMGKTTLLLNMILQDIEAGKGVGLVDPHGDLIKEKLLPRIPERRIEDVVLFDPTDTEYPVGFNMLKRGQDEEIEDIVQDVSIVLQRLGTRAWTDIMGHLLESSVQTLLLDTRTHTLPDIRRIVSDEGYRKNVLSRVDDGDIHAFWDSEFYQMQKSTKSSVQVRLGDLFRSDRVKRTLGQRETTFNLQEVMDNKKIFLARLPDGILKSSAYLFGSLLVSKIQLTAMSRAYQEESRRTPFYLYMDEFQNFVNPSFLKILPEARKYRLFPIMAHQHTSQLSTDIRDSIFGTMGACISFQIGEMDAPMMSKVFSEEVEAADLSKLPEFHTFVRIGTSDNTFTMTTIPETPPVRDDIQEIIDYCREKYSVKLIPEPVIDTAQVYSQNTARIETAQDTSRITKPVLKTEPRPKPKKQTKEDLLKDLFNE